MNLTTRTLDALKDWITSCRQESPLLDGQADTILLELQRIKARLRRLNTLDASQVTLGCYGHAQQGKDGLLAAMQPQPDGRVEIVLGETSLDYFTHINPQHRSPAIAVRFTQMAAPVMVPDYPLRLALFSECELVTQFMLRYQQTAAPRQLSVSQINQRLAELDSRCLPEPIRAQYAEELAQLLPQFRRLQRRDRRLDPRQARQICKLATSLVLSDRAELFSLFWGEDSGFTQAWLRQARLLEQLGYADQALAPSGLILDAEQQPAAGFLFPETDPAAETAAQVVTVCPLIKGVSLPPVTLSRGELASICAEVILTQRASSRLPSVDWLDIPLSHLEIYTRRLQPDILLICNSVNQLSERQAMGEVLSRWVDCTQSSEAGALPGLVWVITAADLRFSSGVNLEEGVQARVGQARVRWGILQAQDNRNMYLLGDWLQDALTPGRKERRLKALYAALEKQTANLFYTLARGTGRDPREERQQAEALIKSLQGQIPLLGTLLSNLTPSRNALNHCWLRDNQQTAVQDALTPLKIDLFAEPSQPGTTPAGEAAFAEAVYRLWVNHIDSVLSPGEGQTPCLLKAEDARTLRDILLATSYRLGLTAQLTQASAGASQELAVARCHAVLGDFTGWLGYADTPDDDRPVSRINPPNAIFAPATPVDIHHRLSKLDEQPALTNARYVYDWLVALYTRATENSEQQAGRGSVTEKQRQILSGLLA